MATSAPLLTTVQSTGSTVIAWVPDDVMWLLVVGFIVAFFLAFSVGANDVANSFGTTVGAEVLTIRQACVLATIFETAGAVLLGAKVGEMIRKGIIDVEVYQIENGSELLMMGEVSAMFGAGVWQLIATLLKIPVSGTHSIVGACIGFSLVAIGAEGVHWSNLGYIVASWFVSPVLAGIMSVLLYHFVSKFIIQSNNPLQVGLKVLPLFYSVTVGINIFSILYSGAPLLGFDAIPIWGTILLAIFAMVVVAIVTQCAVVPRVRSRAESGVDESINRCGNVDIEKTSTSSEESINCSSKLEANRGVPLISEKRGESSSSRDDCKVDAKRKFANEQELTKQVRFFEEDDSDHSYVVELKPEPSKASFIVQLSSSNTSINRCGQSGNDERSSSKMKKKTAKITKKLNKLESTKNNDKDSFVVRQLFSSIQVLTASFASFAHGGNDVSNAIGPLIALWIVFWSGEVMQKSFTPWYLLLYGGIGISIGLWLMGRRVMETLGKDLTKVTPSRGFCIEIMTAMTVVAASNLGIPISTTHCKVGAVVSIGWYRSRAAVDWSVVRNIALAWFVTLPISGFLSAFAMWIFMKFL